MIFASVLPLRACLAASVSQPLSATVPAKEALRLAAQKLPVKTKFVVRRDYVEE